MSDREKIETSERQGFIVDIDRLPPEFPTHLHTPEFWEHLGRTVATFGFLEEILGKAIFSFTATVRYSEENIDVAFSDWLPTLERALSDPLGNLIESYAKAVRNNPESKVGNLDELLAELRRASVIRNVLCHGSWRSPDGNGRSLPLFVNKQKQVWDGLIDISFLRQTQQAAAKLCCHVMTSVTLMGWNFPGSHGPGIAIYRKD